jgi:hypothetical protein
MANRFLEKLAADKPTRSMFFRDFERDMDYLLEAERRKELNKIPSKPFTPPKHIQYHPDYDRYDFGELPEFLKESKKEYLAKKQKEAEQAALKASTAVHTPIQTHVTPSTPPRSALYDFASKHRKALAVGGVGALGLAGYGAYRALRKEEPEPENKYLKKISE